MKNEEIFQFENITYSIVDVFRREIRVGTGIFNESIPNAVNASYSGQLLIPNFITYSNKLWRVTEIGTCAFVYCQSITSVRVGYNVEVVRQQAFFRCRNIVNITFEKNSLLKTLENACFYDLYAVECIEFGGDKLQTIGDWVFGYAFVLKNIRFPASVKFMDQRSLRGMFTLERIDYCSKSAVTKDVFYRGEPDEHITPTNLIIKVTTGYGSSTFGINDNIDIDDSINCYFPPAISDNDLNCRTIYGKNDYRIAYSLVCVFILMYDS